MAGGCHESFVPRHQKPIQSNNSRGQNEPATLKSDVTILNYCKLTVNHQCLVHNTYSSIGIPNLKKIGYTEIKAMIVVITVFCLFTITQLHSVMCSSQKYSIASSSSVAQNHWNHITNAPYSFFSTHLQTFSDYSMKGAWSLFYGRHLWHVDLCCCHFHACL